MNSAKKIIHFIDNKNNIINIIILLIVLYIIYRLFTTDINKQRNYNNKNETIENFEGMNIPYYGNIITLNNNNNEPIESNNQYIFNLQKSYRIDCLVFKFKNNNNISNINVKYKYGNDNDKYLKNDNSYGSSPTFDLDTDNKIKINNIVNENNTLVYTSQIILILNSDNTIQDTLQDTLDSYGIFGGERKLLTQKYYQDKTITDNITNIEIAEPPLNLIKYNSNNNITQYTYNINHENDNMKIYCIKLYYKKNTYTNNTINNVDIKIGYENTLYPLDTFKIKKTYKIRCDKYSLDKNNSNPNIYIILDEPIIANKLLISTSIEQSNLKLKHININANKPTSEDINEYKNTVNLVINKDNSLETNICPNINELVEKQNKTQDICDNLEYQDKIKSEKIRLERNKQYLLKLKTQQEQISELNNVIEELDKKRKERENTADQIRVLQYQKQKGDASTINDLANQRLESQDNNKLFMDLNLNYTN
jgi:hypothetical protein